MTSATCNEPYFFLLKWIKWKDELYTPSSSLEKLSDDFLNIENCPGHIWFVILAPTILQVILLWGRKHEAKRCTVCSYGTYRWGRNKTQQSWNHQEESDRSIQNKITDYRRRNDCFQLTEWGGRGGGGFMEKVIFELGPKGQQTWGKLGKEKW